MQNHKCMDLYFNKGLLVKHVYNTPEWRSSIMGQILAKRNFLSRVRSFFNQCSADADESHPT